MPRPSLRRTVSSPSVRARSFSNPYPLPSHLSSQQSIFSSATARNANSNSNISRRVMSTNNSASSSSIIMENDEYSHPISSPSDPESPSSDQTRTRSRRVLADITWWFDGQLCSMEGLGGGHTWPQVDGELDASPVLLQSGFESLESTDLTEGPGSPEAFAVDYPPSPTSSTTSSTSARLEMVLEEAIIPSIPWALTSPPSLKSRREASYSSISSSDLEFEDVVPCPMFV